MAPYGYDKRHMTADGTVLRTLRWMADGSKQEFGPDGKFLRVIEAGVNIKKAKSDIIRFVPSTPERVAVVRRMFDLCMHGYGCHYIAALFNAEGIASPGGQNWNTSRIAKLLRNPVYKGAIAWNRHTMGSLFSLDGNGVLKAKKQKGWKRNAEEDWIISENVHEPLVTPETWSAAQRSLTKRHVDGGKARPTNRSLLASLMVCNRCRHNFVQRRDRRWPGPNGDGYRYYSCSGYHRYGKAVCGLTNLPGPALDAFVVQAIQRVLLGDHATTKQAVEAFVKAVLAPRAATKRTKTDDRELDLLNRKIKATVAMLADPTFDGLDELLTTLADLKARRDALATRLKLVDQPATPAITEDELRRWALAQFARLTGLAAKRAVDLQDRQLVEAFVQRIEVNPEAKTGEIIFIADLTDAFREGSTREPIEDGRVGTEEGTIPLVNHAPGDYHAEDHRLFLCERLRNAMLIHVGHSPDPDDAFMFHALANDKIDTGPYQFTHDLQDIETLNRRALKGELELTAVSLHGYAYLTDQYALCACGCSMGDNYGPMVVAKQAASLGDFRGKRIAIPGTMTTAYLALRLALPEFEPVVYPFDEILNVTERGEVDAGLIIHEGQLTYQNQGLHLITDLGQWWLKDTGLPLPLGGNAIRRDLGEQAMRDVTRLLKQSIQYALGHRQEALQHALQYGRDLDRSQADKFVGMYVNDWTLDFGDRGREAVRTLLNRAYEAKIVPHPVQLEFITGD